MLDRFPFFFLEHDGSVDSFLILYRQSSCSTVETQLTTVLFNVDLDF